MANLSLKGIQKIYPNGYHAVTDFNLLREVYYTADDRGSGGYFRG